MAFLLGPVLRNVSLATRKEVISWLMPKMVFYMPTVVEKLPIIENKLKI